ncbi:hypothetical protein [Leifsonia virtsii]|uniref:Uncharacterized protein n=1 Tax=Leifsonia virtsii TaxID=3035915 RepID=A0ABT8IWK3_9MICO|nr:hypothetical protein [Leifsonia virtsii]MDN4597180.1 hypothetical protein [Leifsonia virtsii]
MSNLSDIDRRFTDWENCDLPSVRAGLVEAIVAERAEASGRDADATWYGGGTRALDVTSVEDGTLVRRNAKSVRLEKYKGELHVALARYNAQPYDAEKVDRIVMVLLDDASSGFKVDLERGIASMEGHVSIDRIWDVPVSALNDELPDHDPATEGNIRNALFRFEQLEPYLVWRRNTDIERE